MWQNHEVTINGKANILASNTPLKEENNVLTEQRQEQLSSFGSSSSNKLLFSQNTNLIEKENSQPSHKKIRLTT